MKKITRIAFIGISLLYFPSLAHANWNDFIESVRQQRMKVKEEKEKQREQQMRNRYPHLYFLVDKRNEEQALLVPIANQLKELKTSIQDKAIKEYGLDMGLDKTISKYVKNHPKDDEVILMKDLFKNYQDHKSKWDAYQEQITKEAQEIQNQAPQKRSVECHSYPIGDTSHTYCY